MQTHGLKKQFSVLVETEEQLYAPLRNATFSVTIECSG